MAVDVFGELRDEIRSVGLDHTLSPSQRHEKLSALRVPLADALGELDRYRAADQGLREADASAAISEVEWVRRAASIREELIEAGELTAEALDEMGMLSHRELDRLEEEGLLEEAAGSIAERYAATRRPKQQAPPPVDPSAPPKPKPAFGQPDEPDEQTKAQLDAAGERALGSLTDYVGATSEQSERAATPALQQIVEQEGGQLSGLDQRLKPRASIRAKIKRRRDTMPLASDQERAQIPDGARYTAVFPDAGYVQGVERTLSGLDKAGFKQKDSRNSWGEEDWAGLVVIFAGPGGASVEVSFQTPASQKANQANASIAGRFRKSDDPHERWSLWQQMAENVAKAPTPKGANELGDTRGTPVPGVDGLPTAGKDSAHSVVPPEQLTAGDRAQDPLHGGVVNAAGPAKTVASVAQEDTGHTTVAWDDGSSSRFSPGSSVKKLRPK